MKGIVLADETIDSIVNGVATRTEFTYVKSDDIDGTDYITGSEGQVKQIKTYQEGESLQTIIFKYQEVNYPTKPTVIERM